MKKKILQNYRSYSKVLKKGLLSSKKDLASFKGNIYTTKVILRAVDTALNKY